MKPDSRKRVIHALSDDGMVLCNPRDKEASHRALMRDIATSNDPSKVSCKKCRSLFTDFAAESPYFPKESLVAKRVSEANETATKPL